MKQPETASSKTPQPIDLTLEESKLIAAAADVEHAIITFDWPHDHHDLALGHSYITPAANAMSGAEVHVQLVDFGMYSANPLDKSAYFGFKAYWVEKSKHAAHSATPENTQLQLDFTSYDSST